jgi:hypothetical protein
VGEPDRAITVSGSCRVALDTPAPARRHGPGPVLSRRNSSPMAAVIQEQVQELDRDEGLALIENEAQRLLGMSALDFIAKWDAGELADAPGVTEVALLLPFGR